MTVVSGTSFTVDMLKQALRELNNERAVAQHYISKPLLISGHKFDIRIYALVISCSPLSVFVYRDGIARFATIPHEAPAASNLRTACMHLTNHAINRRSSLPKGGEGPEVCLKWRLHSLLEHLDSIGAPSKCSLSYTETAF
jgi:tubulin polyglutamylase TTLL6/13